MYVNQLCAELVGTRGSYTVKIQAQAEKTFDDTTAIYEVRIDDDNQEVILFPVVTLKQASAEMDKARMDVLSEYITEVKRLELEVTRLKAELEPLRSTIRRYETKFDILKVWIENSGAEAE